MAVPDRPVEGEPIATDWGQEVHDFTFAPSGCVVHSSSGNTNIGTTLSKLNLDTVDDDPGGFLDAANDRVEIPTAKEGLYHIHVRALSVNGSAGSGFQTRLAMQINGANVTYGNEDNAGAVNVPVTVDWVGELAAGDFIEMAAQRKGGGSNVDVSVTSFVIYRIGAEMGA